MMGCALTKGEKHEHHLTIQSALLIQTWYRRYKARLEMKRRCTWNIFQNLEYAKENDQVELFNFFVALLKHYQHGSSSLRSSSIATRTSLVDERVDQNSKLSEDPNYIGPQLKFPLIAKDVNNLIDLFRRKKNNQLDAKNVNRLLIEAISRLKRLPNINQASTVLSKQITIVGDLHGKLDDLLVILYKNGLPCAENPYVFNGDFVDRGKKGMEVFLLLISFFLAFPGGVYLNRGNHEDSVMNGRYGFTKEVVLKYGDNAETLLKTIDEVYSWLPLGTIINNAIFVVHGGISDKTNIDMIKNLDRGKYVSILRPPINENGTRMSTETINNSEWLQVFDIMWSDPQHNNGCIPNALRGAGTYFGPNITEQFLNNNNFKYLVRSHECKPEGHEFAHNNKVITIFSASNYYAIGSNKGAYLQIDTNLQPRFVQYISAASKTSALTIRQKVSFIESSAIRALGARIRDKRTLLETEFKKQDPNNTGIISITKWCYIMEKETNLTLPWRLLRDKLAPMPVGSPPNDVNYFVTLEILDSDIIIETQQEETSVAESLYRNKSSLVAIFSILDKDGDGHISIDEFKETCNLLQKHIQNSESFGNILEKFKMMDLNKDGFIDLNEFLEAFRLCDQTNKPNKPIPHKKQTRGPNHESVKQVTKSLARKISDPEDIDPTDFTSK